jgi:hypothetical protein
MLNGPCHIHSAFIDGKRVSRHAIKDCTTFLKLQEAALNKQTEARRQGFEGSNNPPIKQQGNNGVPQGQDQQNQGHDDDEGYVPSKGHITAMIQPISLEFLKPTDCSFHGIVPGSANYPLGRITLNVCFGNRQNYRREKLNFEVMDKPSQYHAILGRPAFSRFMAVSHYTYLVLKMPGPRGIITVKGSFEVSDLCDREFHKMAQNFGMIANYA